MVSQTRINGEIKEEIIWYVDGFAGEGKYNDGSDGSQTLGLPMAEQIQEAKRGYELACYFVESVRKRWQTLEALAVPFRRDGINIVNERVEFSSFISRKDRETRGAPILLVIDPFGVKPLK